MEYEGIDTSNKTLPDYQNFRNVLFQQWQELNNSTVEYRCCAKIEKRVFKRQFIKCFLKFYGQIQHENKLNHLQPKQRKFLSHFNKNPNLIDSHKAMLVNKITRELMESYGVFDIGSGGDDELW